MGQSSVDEGRVIHWLPNLFCREPFQHFCCSGQGRTYLPILPGLEDMLYTRAAELMALGRVLLTNHGV
jgi:hypothetical protein